MEDYQSWRDLLAAHIRDPREKKRIARAIGVTEATLKRWIKNEATPNQQQLACLLEAIPQYQMLLKALIAEEFEEFESEQREKTTEQIPLEFSAHILDLYANTPEESRFWSICTAVLTESIKQLDPDNSGLTLSVAECLTSMQEKRVRYLRESLCLDTHGRQERGESGTRFLGAESLAGYAVNAGQPQILVTEHIEQEFTDYLPEKAGSAAAFPILHAQHIAGCLVVVSAQADFFDKVTHIDLIQSYTALLALAFSPEHFYAREQIALQIMPSLQIQQPYLVTLPQRIIATLKTAFNVNHPLSYPEAQRYVWWQMAEELAQLQRPQS